MTELLLEESRWPAGLPAAHRDLLRSILEGARKATGVVGLAAGGSFASGKMDEFSDIDLVVAVEPSAEVARPESRRAFAGRLGPLLAAFPGDHVVDPRLLFCLYVPPLLHVDLKFLSLEELLHRIEDPAILWDRDGALRAAISRSPAEYPRPRFQWIEDRFWVWVHYTATKINRGELFEAIDALAFVRAKVLGSLALLQAGVRPSGMRRVEQRAPARIAALRSTLSFHDTTSCRDALMATVALYTELREQLAPTTMARRTEAERAVRNFLAGTDRNSGVS